MVIGGRRGYEGGGGIPVNPPRRSLRGTKRVSKYSTTSTRPNKRFGSFTKHNTTIQHNTTQHNHDKKMTKTRDKRMTKDKGQNGRVSEGGPMVVSVNTNAQG